MRGGGDALGDLFFFLLSRTGEGLWLGNLARRTAGGEELGLFLRTGDGERRLLGETERLAFRGDGEYLLLLQWF